MSGISNISKKIQKSYCRMQLNRKVSQILKENNKYLNELITINSTPKENCCNVSVAGLQTQNVSNRTNDLRMWVLNHNIPRRAVNDLLKILKGIGLRWLCNDSRTLCKLHVLRMLFHWLVVNIGIMGSAQILDFYLQIYNLI